MLAINTRKAIMTSMMSMMRTMQPTTTGPAIAPTLTGGIRVTVESRIIEIHSSKF